MPRINTSTVRPARAPHAPQQPSRIRLTLAIAIRYRPWFHVEQSLVAACAAAYNPFPMLSENRLRELLEPFELPLTANQLGKVDTYLELLLRWNRRVNLTAIRSPEECVTRHFGEILYLARWLELRGTMLDIGSGAGFPGLALKIAFPGLSTTLLEPAAKKRAFLKEVARACEMESVAVRPERLEEFLRMGPPAAFDAVTSRAVGQLGRLVPLATRCLLLGARLCLWISQAQAAGPFVEQKGIRWDPPIPVPMSRQRVILCGTRILSVIG